MTDPRDMVLQRAEGWIDECVQAGTKKIGTQLLISTNTVIILADKKEYRIPCLNFYRAKELNSRLHEYVGNLPIKVACCD